MYNVFVGVGEETVWGTPVARTKFCKAHEGNQIDHEIDQSVSSVISGNVGGDPENMFIKGEKATGTIIIPSSYDDGVRMKVLKHALGACSSSGPVSGLYTHTFTRQMGPPFLGGGFGSSMGMSFEVNYQLNDGNAANPLPARLVEGGLIDTIEWSWKAQEEVKLQLGILGEQMTQVNKSASPSFPDLVNYLMNYGQAGLNIDSAAIATPIVVGASLKLKNGFNDIYTIGTTSTRQPRRKGKSDPQGTLSVLWDQTQCPSTAATNAGSASTSLNVAAAIFQNGDTIVIGTNAPVLVSSGGGTAALTLASAQTWSSGAAVALAMTSATALGSSSTALTITNPIFQTGDYIKIGSNAPVFVTAGGGTTALTISTAQSWASAATVQLVSSTAKYLWDKFRSKSPASFQIVLTGPNGYSETVLINNVRLGSPKLQTTEGAIQEAEFPFWALNDAVNTMIKITLVNANSAI